MGNAGFSGAFCRVCVGFEATLSLESYGFCMILDLRKQMEDMIMEHHKFTESKDPLVDAMRKAVADLDPLERDLKPSSSHSKRCSRLFTSVNAL